MAKSQFVFDVDTEFVGERSTGYGSTSFGLSDVTPLGFKSSTRHSTFEEPSHAIDRVRARTEKRSLKARVIALAAVLAVVALGSALFLLLLRR